MNFKNRTCLSLALGVIFVAASLLPAGAAADDGTGEFDLRVDLNLTGELSAALEPGDVLQLSLRPSRQYGQRDVVGQPFILQKAWQPGTLVEQLRFTRALDVDTIYELEFKIIRMKSGRDKDVTYVSALYKLPRTPIDEPIKMRLFQTADDDERENLVMVTRDEDGVYRVSLFFA